MRFEWDGDKNRRNLLRHDVRFETAVLVFDDPFALTQRDESSGAIGPKAILLVVHTWLEKDGEEVVRIISARAAGSRERRNYEEAHEGTKARHRRDRGQERRGH